MFNLIGALISGLLLGIGGSLLAGAVGGYRGQGINRAGCLASVLGAMALIFIGRHLF